MSLHKEVHEKEVERSTAMKGLMQWVRLHPYNIASKVQIVVEHFRENVQPLLAGRAKAMVVVGSRKEAVRWQKAIRGYIAQRNYPLGVLVAFSGEVNDPDSFPEAVTEHSELLNPGLRGQDIRKVFDGPEYHLLLVANKFQTGFDQPLLCGMYVDKLLGGIQAVQTRWCCSSTTWRRSSVCMHFSARSSTTAIPTSKSAFSSSSG